MSVERARRVPINLVISVFAFAFLVLGGSPGHALDDPLAAPADAHSAHHPAGAAPVGSPAPGGDATAVPPAAAPASPPAGMGGMMEMMKGMMSPSSPATPSPPPAAMAPMNAETANTPATPPSSAPPAMGAGGMGGGGMGAAAGCCGGSASKPFYATLMQMPALTPEARRFIETEANSRIGTGSEQITTGQNQLHQAMAASDPGAVQRAAAGVRQGLLLVESGASALQAMNEGQPPPKIALAWFKGQASVPNSEGMSMGDGLWGLSWFHLITMTFFIVFLTAVLLIQFNRMRRVTGLVDRLGGISAAGPKPPDKAGSPPATAAQPASGTPAPVAAPGKPGDKPAAAPAGGKPASPSAAPAAGVPGPAKPAADAPKKPWSGALSVAAIFQETPSVKTFRLMRADCGPMPFTYLPGQFLTFSAKHDGKPIRRSYTISSSPTQRDYVEITVKREEQGIESRYLHDNVSIGDLLDVSGPSGVFTFTGREAQSIVLIAGGVGITPMMCVTRYLTDRSHGGDIFFLYGARTPGDFVFREELEYLQKRHPNLHVVATMADVEGTSWTGAKGHITKDFIANSVPEIARKRVHLCGPPPMMEAVKKLLAELGVAKEKIKTEAFGPALGAAPAPAAPSSPAPASPGLAPANPDAAAASPGPEPAKPDTATTPAEAAPANPDAAAASPGAESANPDAAVAAPAAASAQAQVQFSKSAKSGALAPNQSVLEAAEAIGVAIDFSCRVGTCGTCVVPLTSGTVTMEVEEGLPPDQKAKGIILACQAKSVGNLVVDA